MQETEINLKDILCCVLRKWRKIVVCAVICAILIGSAAAVSRVIDMNDDEVVERWQTEYELAQGMYWASIYDLDRKISENERLADKTEYELSSLDRQKTEYEAEIVDLEEQINYYNILIENYKANNERLKLECDNLNYYLTYRKEQNENSLLMAIDPYDVNVYEVYLRIDSGYEILPENTYQNIDRTAELLQTYCLLVGKTNFYNQMISDLKLNTEVRYLTEVISVSKYNINSICVRVMSDSSAWSKMVAEYIADALLGAHAHVQTSIAEHEITEYNAIAYSAVDLNVYSVQQNYIQKAFDYEESIRYVNESILNNEASIRGINADIREFRTRIDKLNQMISSLPMDKQVIEDKISTYRDANYALRQEQMELREKSEPKYEGYTTFNIFTGFVKFAVIGGIVGAFGSALFFAVMTMIVSDKILSSEQLNEVLKCEFFGYWPQTRKKLFGFVDRWINCISDNPTVRMTYEMATSLVMSNACVACKDAKKIMLCGGASQETIAAIAEAMKAQLPAVEVICGGTIDCDPVVVRGVAECDAVILVEQLDKSDIKTTMQLKNRAKTMNKPVLGVVLH